MAHQKHVGRIAGVLAVLIATGCVGTAAASAETATPTAAAQIAHAEFLPFMDPPPAGPATVCLVDTGVDLNPDTESTVIERVALDGGDGGDVWPEKHGTEMAMAMGAPINGWGTVGAWPLVKIVSVRAMGPGEIGLEPNAYSRSILACLNHSSIRVINLSLSGDRPTERELAELDDYAARARNAGVSIIAGAGNTSGPVEWPAADPHVIAVAANGLNRNLCTFSADGPSVAVAAPGCDIQLADPLSGESLPYAGTSPAAAVTATALAALRSYRPDLSADQAESLIRDSASGRQLDVEATFRAAGLGEQVDAALARMRETGQTGAPLTATGGRPVQSVANTTSARSRARPAWPRTKRLPKPRVRITSCSPRGLTLRLTNRPSMATAVVLGYRRRLRSGPSLAIRLSSPDSTVRLHGTFESVVVRYRVDHRAPSAPTQILSCRSGR